jgi:hypothetical protein
MQARALAITLASLACGCGGTIDAPGTGGSSTVPASSLPHVCDTVAEAHPIEGQTHVPSCSPVSYGTNPPSSGNHYPVWAAFKTYAMPVPRGFLVHDLEHGAVVVTYNCPEGCPDDVAKIEAWLGTLSDHACKDTAVVRRVVVSPDPLLDVRFAAAAWGVTLRAPCFDPASFTDFFVQHIGQGPEQLCADGQDLATAPPAASCGK